MRERERGVQGDGGRVRWGNTLLTRGHPLDGGRGGREYEEWAGGERDKVDVEEEEKGRRRLLSEKDCSAWVKWAGRGRGVVATGASTATDMTWGSSSTQPCQLVSCTQFF